MKNLSLIALIVVNIIPIFGVIFFDWSFFGILLAYWLENFVVGFYNILKMSKAELVDRSFMVDITKSGKEDAAKKSRIINFFFFHYGIFCLGHGIALYMLYLIFGESGLLISTFIIMTISFFISHGISYYQDYIKKEEYKQISPGKLAKQPYGRLITIHVTIILIGFSIVFLKTPIFGLIFLIIAKIIIDLISYLNEHNQLEGYKKSFSALLHKKI